MNVTELEQHPSEVQPLVARKARNSNRRDHHGQTELPFHDCTEAVHCCKFPIAIAIIRTVSRTKCPTVNHIIDFWLLYAYNMQSFGRGGLCSKLELQASRLAFSLWFSQLELIP